jgi:hypothetical protein
MQFIPTHGYNKRSLVPRHLPGVSILKDFSNLPMVLKSRRVKKKGVDGRGGPAVSSTAMPRNGHRSKTTASGIITETERFFPRAKLNEALYQPSWCLTYAHSPSWPGLTRPSTPKMRGCHCAQPKAWMARSSRAMTALMSQSPRQLVLQQTQDWQAPEQ